MTDLVIHSKELVVHGINYLANINPNTWEAIGTAIGASGILSPLLMAVKKFLKVEKDWVMFATVILACFTVVAFAYMKDTVHINPVLATTLLTVLTNVLYYAIFKPLKKYYGPKLAAKVAQIKLLNQSKVKLVSELDDILEEVPGKITGNPSL